MPHVCNPLGRKSRKDCQGYEASLDYQSEPLSQILKYNNINFKALLTFKRLTVLTLDVFNNKLLLQTFWVERATRMPGSV